jgi:hypothetical protein
MYIYPQQSQNTRIQFRHAAATWYLQIPFGEQKPSLAFEKLKKKKTQYR